MNKLYRWATFIKRLIEFEVIVKEVRSTAFFLHYVPDISGGVANWLLTFAKTYPDYTHLIISSRSDKNGYWVSKLNSQKNVKVVGFISRLFLIANLAKIGKPIAYFNHLFWDLAPVKISEKPFKDVPTYGFLRGSGSKLNATPSDLNRVIVFTPFYQETYEINLPGSLNPLIIGHGINTKRFESIWPLPSSHNQFVVGNLTNGRAVKHAEDFVNLCEAIQEKISFAEFKFLGADDIELGVKNHPNFILYPSNSKKPEDYLSEVHIIIHKTQAKFAEGWSNAIGEILAAGVPLVAEAKGGIKAQIIHGETGFLCETNQDFIDYAEMLYRDKELYNRISRQAKAYALEHFSIEGYRQRFDELVLNR